MKKNTLEERLCVEENETIYHREQEAKQSLRTTTRRGREGRKTMNKRREKERKE